MSESTGSPSKIRYAVAGLGHRSYMYIHALLNEHADVGELVAFCEPNPTRYEYYNNLLQSWGHPGVPNYVPEDLETMITENKVASVIIGAPDYTHADLIDRSMRAGADVVVEKPITIDEAGCKTINSAVAATGRNVIMTFNYRYSPRNSELRRVIASGEIGEVTSVHFEWALDTVHGADYFRRWHREKKNSGGLLIHKASHHFDLVNWWINAAPTTVYTRGGLKFYGNESGTAKALAAADEAAGLPPRPQRGTGSWDGTRGWVGRKGDRWTIDLRADERLDALYLQAEHHDGYHRDQDVFGPGITIEDNISLLADYDNGAQLTYSLNAHAPWEGYKVTVNGTLGRAELDVVERGSISFDENGRSILDPSATPDAWAGDTVRPFGDTLVVQKHWERAYEVDIPEGIGGHGGGDAILLKDVFLRPLGGLEPDPLERPAGYLDGIRAVATGIAANQSLITGLPVNTGDLNLGADITKNHLK